MTPLANSEMSCIITAPPHIITDPHCVLKSHTEPGGGAGVLLITLSQWLLKLLGHSETPQD